MLRGIAALRTKTRNEVSDRPCCVFVCFLFVCLFVCFFCLFVVVFWAIVLPYASHVTTYLLTSPRTLQTQLNKQHWNPHLLVAVGLGGGLGHNHVGLGDGGGGVGRNVGSATAAVAAERQGSDDEEKDDHADPEVPETAAREGGERRGDSRGMSDASNNERTKNGGSEWMGGTYELNA